MSWSTSAQGSRSSHERAAEGDDTACDGRPACFNASASEAVTEGSSSTIRIIGTKQTADSEQPQG
ncbi:MAG: hypothetical protein BWZ09_02775 [Alphaproteobacteria bacterium ADurb.BinA305]|nr:MAG: hypothetical protein BWZ09_02775 [Alphaproteobacteria bacterium ADurb.BinA305]